MGNTCQPICIERVGPVPDNHKKDYNNTAKSIQWKEHHDDIPPLQKSSTSSPKSTSGSSSSEGKPPGLIATASSCEDDAKSTKSTDSSVLTHSLHTKMTREQKNRDIYKYYEVVEVLGVGSMGSVSCVRKKKQHLGGSARKKVSKKINLWSNSKQLFNLGRIPDAFEVVKNGSPVNMNRATSDISHLSTHSVPSDSCYECLYALKSIHLQRISDKAFLEELRNEIDILKSLDHPNIVRAIETFEYRSQMCIVMELCSGGDLYTRDPYTEKEAGRIIKQLLSAVAYMHRCGIMHRDLKFENILFENDNPDAVIKLVDFGLSKKYMPDAPHMYDGVGTIYTMAPQVLEGEYNSQADVWSVGVVAFMLLASQMPFYGKKRRHVFEKIMKCHYSFKGPRWQAVSNQAKDFVRALLQKNPDDRPSAEEALKLPWLQNNNFSFSSSSSSSSSYHTSTSAPSEQAPEQVMECVQESIENFSKYSKIKKLALMVVAHKSTTEEIGFLRDAFEEYDLEKNGTISYQEFKMVLSDSGYTEEELMKMFRGVDLDGSGYIHYTEFLAATLEAKGVIVEERIAEAFDRLDSDDSGYISRQNLRSLLKDGFEGRELSEQLVSEIIAEGDFKKDGRISYEEFLMLWDQHEDEDIKNTLRGMTTPLKQFPSNLSGNSSTASSSR